MSDTLTNNKLIIITGPTASGKTSLSIELAKAINGEIISADSMQVYKGMDIGTAKVTKEEMHGIKHYLIDCLDPKDEFNVSVFKEMATKALEEIYSKGKIPIICGGTGFYIQALLYDIKFDEETTSYKEELQAYYEENGEDALFELLRSVDPESCEIIPKQNIKRVIRAIEFYKLHGMKISEHNKTERAKESKFDFGYYCITADREVMYERIDKRVDIMFDNGLVDEVKGLMDMGLDKTYISMQGIGYKEVIDYLNGETTLEEAKYIIKRDTRHFAKRQLTWFRREKCVDFIERKYAPGEEKTITEKIIKAMNL